MKHIFTAVSALLCAATLSGCTEPPQIVDQPPSDIFADRWNSGLQDTEPDLQLQPIDANTFALRQSLHTTFEAPFMYLLFGEEKALLIDTGVAGVNLREKVDNQVKRWLKAKSKAKIDLIVMHTHGHGDHVGGDEAFTDRSNTTVVGHSPEDVASFFGLKEWPDGKAEYKLGERTLDIIPTPGHHPSHVMVYDRQSKLLFSGDSLYPGRLYFQCGQLDEYRTSISRVATFAKTNEIRAILGAHIELSLKAGKSFGGNDRVRVGERLIELPTRSLADLQAALRLMENKPVVRPFSDFILFPHPADPRGKEPPNWCLPENNTK